MAWCTERAAVLQAHGNLASAVEFVGVCVIGAKRLGLQGVNGAKRSLPGQCQIGFVGEMSGGFMNKL